MVKEENEKLRAETEKNEKSLADISEMLSKKAESDVLKMVEM